MKIFFAVMIFVIVTTNITLAENSGGLVANVSCYTQAIEVQSGYRAISGLALSPDESKIYAAYWTDTWSDPLAVYSTNGCPLPLFDTMSYGRCHGGVAISSNGRYLFTPSYYEDDISRFDLLNGNNRTSLGAGSWPLGVGISPDGSKLVVFSGREGGTSGSNNDAIYIYDVSNDNFSFLRSASLNDELTGVKPVFSNDSQYVYVTTFKRNSPQARLYEICLNDSNTRYLDFPITSTNLPSICRNDQYLFVSDKDNSKIWIVDPISWSVYDYINLDFAPATISIHPDKRHLFITAWSEPLSNIVYIYDVINKTMGPKVDLGYHYPRDIIFTQDGKKAFVSHSSQTEGGITVLDVSQALEVKSPNGGEDWVAGTTKIIEWQSNDPCISQVKIELSINNGIGWNDVNTVTNNGSYNWLVPQVNSNQCLVRISSATDSNVFDISDNTFVIYQCKLNSKADLDGNCKVDAVDLALFANDWLKNGNPFDPDFTEPPEGMVVVPAGEFPYQNTEPKIFVDSFYIDKFETTNEKYCQFLNAADPCSEHWVVDMSSEISRSGSPGDYNYTVQTGREIYPVRWVNLYDANAYAQWKSSVEGVTYRLPTEQEWEKAAGWDPTLQKLWTYGYQQDIIDCSWCNYINCGYYPFPVGSYNGTNGKKDAKSYYGCYDMSGNLSEWVPTLKLDGTRIVRSGSFTNIAEHCQTTQRFLGVEVGWRAENIGFRLIRELK
jgi:formylglycine-generating enzyme required for sulfatase activity/DNA-binding beta-propeller fold protein YncE